MSVSTAACLQPPPEASPPALAHPGAVLLVSCYELGHPPFAIASPWAQLEQAGFGVAGVDTSLEPLDAAAVARARLVAISVPMHTAVRLGSEIARRVRAQSPAAHVCLFGLYAALNAEHLLASGIADSVIGGEFEPTLVELAGALAAGLPVRDVAGLTTLATLVPAKGRASLAAPPVLRRLPFVLPRRDGLPALDRYARLIGPARGEERLAGYVEASRGCLHRCLHCPITPVYDGRFFIVPREVVLADADQQIRAGACHVTFGDPDFLNGVGHSMAIAHALHAAHPGVTFDVTAKVEHLLRHRALLPELARLGCAFIVSAVESLSDRVLAALDKGHTRADVFEALRITRKAGIAMRPSLVAFTPWTTLDDYRDLCDFIVAEGLEGNVDPIQMAIRLLVPPGSALLAGERARPWLGALVSEEFGYRWAHPEPAMDALHAAVSRRVEEGTQAGEDAAATFDAIRRLAYRAAGREAPVVATKAAGAFVPHLTEPWFCCAEPSRVQMEQAEGKAEAKAGGCCAR